MTQLPLIALSATTEVVRDSLRVRVNASYVAALETAGLLPVIVSPTLAPDALASLMERVDGLVLSGGEDLDPAEYGADPHPAAGAPNRARDACELFLAREAAARRLPTLAICRGIQVVNVALGGTLVQDIPSERASAVAHNAGDRRDARVHPITIEADSRLARSVGATTIATNSFHHQAIDRLASGLRTVARTHDDIVEAAEAAETDWWMVAVQWHPEELVHTAESWDRDLFTAFAEAVRARRAWTASQSEGELAVR